MTRQTDLRWFDPTHDFQVGETVLVFDVNARGRGPREAPVVKVGRTLLHVEVFGRVETYRLNRDGSRPRNDNYQHTSVLTPAEVAYRERVRATARELNDHGVEVHRPDTWPVETLEKILAIVRCNAPFPAGDTPTEDPTPRRTP